MTQKPKGTVTTPEVRFTRVFDAPRELVFAVWTQADHLQRWWGPVCFTNPRCELDLRPGGALRIDMRAPDGMVYPMTGEYREIVPPERLVFMSAALDANGEPMFEVTNTVTFADIGGKTEMTLHAALHKMTDAAAPYIGGMEMGWTQSLEKLAAYLANRADTSDREIVITREYDAPRDLVFTAFTDPAHIVHWWGPNGFTNTIHEMDVRPGGVWRFMMHGPDGTDYPNRIAYMEVKRPERLVYAHSDDVPDSDDTFIVTVRFDALGSKTRVTLKLVFVTPEQCKKTKAFGAVELGHQTLGRLADYLPKMQ